MRRVSSSCLTSSALASAGRVHRDRIERRVLDLTGAGGQCRCRTGRKDAGRMRVYKDVTGRVVGPEWRVRLTSSESSLRSSSPSSPAVALRGTRPEAIGLVGAAGLLADVDQRVVQFAQARSFASPASSIRSSAAQRRLGLGQLAELRARQPQRRHVSRDLLRIILRLLGGGVEFGEHGLGVGETVGRLQRLAQPADCTSVSGWSGRARAASAGSRRGRSPRPRRAASARAAWRPGSPAAHRRDVVLAQRRAARSMMSRNSLAASSKRPPRSLSRNARFPRVTSVSSASGP